MRTRVNNCRVSRHFAGLITGAGIAMLAMLATASAQETAPSAPAPGQGAAEAPLGSQGADAPAGLPPPNFPIDGWTGKPIPCRCRFEGKQLELGTIVCMSTHVGTVLTRCDIVGNNTSWVPSREPCTPKAGS